MPPAWLHGKLKKAAAEELLQTDGQLPSGRFLVRSAATGHILSVGHKGNVVHCKIVKDEASGVFRINDQTYGENWKSLSEAITRLSQVPLPKKWPVQLTQTVGKEGTPTKLKKKKPGEQNGNKQGSAAKPKSTGVVAGSGKTPQSAKSSEQGKEKPKKTIEHAEGSSKKASGVQGKTTKVSSENGNETKKVKGKNSDNESKTEGKSAKSKLVKKDENAATKPDADAEEANANASSTAPETEVISVPVERAKVDDSFGFSLGQVYGGFALKYGTIVTYSRVEGLEVNDQVLGLAVELSNGDPIGCEVGNDCAAHDKVIEILKRAHLRCELTVAKRNGAVFGVPMESAKVKKRLCGRTVWCQCQQCRKMMNSNTITYPGGSTLTLQPVTQA